MSFSDLWEQQILVTRDALYKKLRAQGKTGGGGNPVPIVFGETKCEATLISAPPCVKGSNSEGVVRTLEYGLCEGEASGVGLTVYNDKSYVAPSSVGFVVALGARSQAPWSYWSGISSLDRTEDIRFLQTEDTTPHCGTGYLPDIYGVVGEYGEEITVTDNYSSPPVELTAVDVNPPTDPATFNVNPDTKRIDIDEATLQTMAAIKDVVRCYVVWHRDGANVGNLDWCGYGGLVVLRGADLLLGKEGTIPRVWCVVDMDGGDINPVDAITTLVTNVDYGLGLDDSILDSIDIGLDGTAATSARRYADQAALLVSGCITETEATSDIVYRLAEGMDADIVFGSDGQLRLIPRCEVDVGTYDAYLTPAAELDEDDFILRGDACIEIDTVDAESRNNCIPVEFVDPTGADANWQVYGKATVEVGDEADRMMVGTRRSEPLKSFLTTVDNARKISSLLSRRSVYQSARLRFSLSPRFIHLECGDLVTLTDAASGLEDYLVRIVSISEDIDSGILDFESKPVVIIDQ